MHMQDWRAEQAWKSRARAVAAAACGLSLLCALCADLSSCCLTNPFSSKYAVMTCHASFLVSGTSSSPARPTAPAAEPSVICDAKAPEAPSMLPSAKASSARRHSAHTQTEAICVSGARRAEARLLCSGSALRSAVCAVLRVRAVTDLA